jgi:L-histidine Nalpha-methyltransferase
MRDAMEIEVEETMAWEPGRVADALAMQFRADVLEGLAQPQKVVPARWFYDRAGSLLFEAITALPDYYPTRTEIGILAAHQADLAARIGPGRVMVDFGAGSAAKTPLVLDAVSPCAYVPVDISGEFLCESCADLQARYPALPILPLIADFTRPLRLPDGLAGEATLGFFPGSTIGNLEPAAATDLLRALAATLGEGALLLIGMDCTQDATRLQAAYNDAAGVTAAFNRNLAERINRELAGTLPVDALEHRAIWNEAHRRIEMHLVATRDFAFTVCGEHFAMAKGETVHTENSHKYSRASTDLLLRAGGWEPLAHYTDAEAQFLVVLAGAISDTITA